MLDQRPLLVSQVDEIDELLGALRPLAWQADALCIEHPEIEFFPPGRGRRVSDQEAKLCCSICLVRVECLSYALELGIRDGIWGGTSPEDRTGQFDPPAESKRLRRGNEAGALEPATAGTRRRRALAAREGYTSAYARGKALAEQRAQSATVNALMNPAARSGDHAV